MAANSIGVPSARGMKDALGDFGVGAVGGLAYGLGNAIFGNGLLGALVSAVLAGSVVKGTRGTVLATVAGFTLLSGALGGGSASAETSSSQAVM